MKFEELKNTLKQKIDDCYLIYGEDEFLRSSAVRQIENYVVTDLPEMNKFSFYGNDISLQSLKTALETLPFMSEKKLVIVRYLDEKKVSNVDYLVEYSSNPNKSCVLIILTKDVSVFKNLKATLVDCDKLSENYVKQFIKKSIVVKNCSITDEAIDLLIAYTNMNMGLISLELDKLVNYTDKIDVDTIKNLVSKNENYQVYELTDAVGRQQNEKVFKILNFMLEDKGLTNKIFWLLYNHFRKLYFISISNKNNIELAQMLSQKEYTIKKLREQLKYFNQDNLKNILQLIYDTEFMVKTGDLDYVSGVKNVIIRCLNKY